jgi:hypothetical protein
MRLCRGPLTQVPDETTKGDGTAPVPRQCVVRRHADEQGVVVRIASSGMMVRQKRGRGRREWINQRDHHRLVLHIAAHHHHLASQQGCRAFIHARDQRCVAPASPY